MNIRSKSTLLAVDPSLKLSGWALFSLADGLPRGFGLIRPPGSEVVLSERLSHLQEEVEELFSSLSLKKGDILTCEGPASLVKNPMSALKLERVRGVFEAVARSRGMVVPGRVNPRTVQTELLGMRGKQVSRIVVKTTAREAVRRLFGERVERLAPHWLSKKHFTELPQDIVDALLVGALAVPRLQLCLKTGAALHTAFLSRSQVGICTPRRRVTGAWNHLISNETAKRFRL